MTKEQMRKEIAEACGWQHVATNHWGTSMFLKGALIGTDPATERSRTIPDYPNDLNAMHEAEEQLALGLEDTYITQLYQILFGNTDRVNNFTNFDVAIVVHANAHQRAEALLKTLKKWKD